MFRRIVAGLSSCALLMGGLAAVTVVDAVQATPAAAASSFISEFQPTVPTKYGGRSISVSINAANTDQVIVATESGGLFRSNDDGLNWSHVDSFPLHRMSDVVWSPNNPSLVVATTWSSGDTTNPGGVWRSTDGGATWQRTTTPGPCGTDFNGWGIAYEPSSNVVYTGSDCGLLTSTDGGATFTRTSIPGWTHAVVARAGGTVDACSDDGHRRFTRSGSTLTLVNGPNAFPAVGPGATTGGCPQVNGGVAPSAHDLAGAPQEAGVLFVMKGGSSASFCGGTVASPSGVNYLFESDDNGVNWTQIGGGCTSRAPWVQTYPSRDGNAADFDIYYSGGLDIYRGTCASGVAGLRCTGLPAIGSSNVTSGHADTSQVVFTPDGTNCARFVVSDGGVERSTDCGANFPMVAGSGSGNGNFNGLQIYEVAGQIHPGSNSTYDFGTQDNSIYGSSDSGATWPNNTCCEGFNFQMKRRAPSPTGRVTFVSCGPCSNQKANTDMSGVGAWTNPGGTALGADTGSPYLLTPTTDTYVQWTADGSGNNNLNLTTDGGSNWNAVSGATTNQALMGHIYVSGPSSDPTLYQPVCTTGCGFIAPSGGLLKITGVNTANPVAVTTIGGGLVRVGSYNDGNGSFRTQEAAFGVDPNNPLRMVAADVGSGNMKKTTDGGQTWTVDNQLTSLVTANGRFGFGAGSRLGSQAHAITFDPTNGNRIFVGTESAGIVYSLDGGTSWTTLPGSGQIPAITSFFVDEEKARILVSSYGRGLWNITLPNADLSVTKTHRPDPATAGTELYYDITATNSGPDDATNATVVDTLPPEVTYVTNTLAAPAGCTALGSTVTCQLGALANGASKTFTIKVAVSSGAVVASGPKAITNTVSINQLGVGDPNSANNTATDTAIVEDHADLVTSKLCKPDTTINAGEPILCTIFVDNTGPSDARGVVVDDTILSSGSFTVTNVVPAISGATPGCTLVPVTGGQQLSCRLGALAAASTSNPGRATITYTINTTAGQDINNVAVARSDTPDPNPNNNRSTVNLTVRSVADLSIIKTGPATAIAGTNVTYNLSVTNGGPSPAANVVVRDAIPIGVTMVSVTPSAGTCNAGVPGDPFQPTTCSLGPLAAGASASVSVTVKVKPDTLGLLHNDARVTSDTFDPNLGNNLATVATSVTGSADLAVTKVSSPSPVLAGNPLTYTITVSNNGPSTATAVRITDSLTTGTTFVSGVDGNGSTVCALIQPNTVICDLATMQPGTTKTVLLTVKVAASVDPGTVLSNTVTVSSATPDPNLANNTSTVTTTVNTSAELWLDKQATQRSGNPSPIVTYTLVVHNDTGCETDAQSSPTPNCGQGGPSDARTVLVVDTLPLDAKKLTVQFISPQCTYDKPTNKVTCIATNVPAGTAVTFVIEAQVQGSVGTIINTATVTSSTPDPVTTNNTNAATLVMKGGTGRTR